MKKYLKIKELKINETHSKIYQINDVDGLAENIKEHGVLERIVVDKNYEIISGVRRYQALKKLGINEVDVEIREVNENDKIPSLIYFNMHRIKTTREILNEAKYLKEIWGQKRGRKSNQDPANTDKNIKKTDTRKKISKTLGISTGYISMLEYIDREKPELFDDIDKNTITVSQAYNALKKAKNEKKVIQFTNVPPTVIKKSDYTIYNKSSDNLSDLANESIQTIFTSPPYWNKRKYSTSTDELGAEKTVDEYVERMATHLHQCYRVLKKNGSFFLNLGDTYYNKCLLSIPHRVAMKLVEKGWILRNTIIWKKTNHLPSPNKDNLTQSYEFIFHFVKSQNYLYNQILVPKKKTNKAVTMISRKYKNDLSNISSSIVINGLKNGKNIEDFWTNDVVTIATANQTTVKKYGCTNHPAPFPPAIVLLPIFQTSNPGDTVLDIFSGTGTVGEVALTHGRKYIGYELNTNFNDMQTSRLDDAISSFNKNATKHSSKAA